MSDLERVALEGVLTEDTFNWDMEHALMDDCGCGGGATAFGLLHDLIDRDDDPAQVRTFIKEWLNERGVWPAGP